MKLNQKIYDDLLNFHKKMQKLTGLEGKRGEKLLKKLKGKMRGGGSDSEETEQMDDLVNYVGQQIASAPNQENEREGRLRQYIESGTIALNDMGAALALLSPDPEVRRRAADAVIRPMENRETARQIVRELLGGIVFATSGATYWFFDGLRDVVQGMRIPYPEPPQVGDDDSYLCQYFGRGCQENSTGSWFSMLWNFGSQGGYYVMMAIAWLTDMLNRLASAGVIGFTAFVFMIMLFFALYIDSVHERGGRIWFFGGLFGTDTRAPPPQSQQQQLPSQRPLDRLQDERGNLPPMRYSSRLGRSGKTRGKTPVRRRNTKKIRKKKKKAKKRAAFGIRDEPKFKFPENDKDPNNDGAGLTTGGKRRKSRKRRKRTRKRSRNLIHKLFRLAGGKRRKRKRKTKRKR